MSDHPFITAFNEFPVSSMKLDSYVCAGHHGRQNRSAASTNVTLSTFTANARSITRPTAANPPQTSNLYTTPFTIDHTTTVRCDRRESSRAKSFPAESVFSRRPNNWTVKIHLGRTAAQYTGGGDNAIVDGIRGTTRISRRASGRAFKGSRTKP